MDSWGAATYGDPCRECGFSWGDDVPVLIARMRDTPAEWSTLLAGADGSERHPDLAWTVAEYVLHVADNLRIWAERLAASARQRPLAVAAYDQDQLAAVRSYSTIPLSGAMWSLDHAVTEWCAAVDITPAEGAILLHLERGTLGRDDIVSANAHDTHHHRVDIVRCLRGRRPDL